MDIRRSVTNRLVLLQQLHELIDEGSTIDSVLKSYINSFNSLDRLQTDIAQALSAMTHPESLSTSTSVKPRDPLGIHARFPSLWNPEMHCYEVKLAGNLCLQGNIGNVYNKHQLQHCVLHQIRDCDQQEDCQRLTGGILCPYYHQPEGLRDMLDRGAISREVYDMQKKQVRNFMNTSWVYSSAPQHKRMNVRMFGSSDTLDRDLQILKTLPAKNQKKIIDTFKSQVCHDLLVLYVLKSKGFSV